MSENVFLKKASSNQPSILRQLMSGDALNSVISPAAPDLNINKDIIEAMNRKQSEVQYKQNKQKPSSIKSSKISMKICNIDCYIELEKQFSLNQTIKIKTINIDERVKGMLQQQKEKVNEKNSKLNYAMPIDNSSIISYMTTQSGKTFSDDIIKRLSIGFYFYAPNPQLDRLFIPILRQHPWRNYTEDIARKLEINLLTSFYLIGHTSVKIGLMATFPKNPQQCRQNFLESEKLLEQVQIYCMKDKINLIEIYLRLIINKRPSEEKIISKAIQIKVVESLIKIYKYKDSQEQLTEKLIEFLKNYWQKITPHQKQVGFKSLYNEFSKKISNSKHKNTFYQIFIDSYLSGESQTIIQSEFTPLIKYYIKQQYIDFKLEQEQIKKLTTLNQKWIKLIQKKLQTKNSSINDQNEIIFNIEVCQKINNPSKTITTQLDKLIRIVLLKDQNRIMQFLNNYKYIEKHLEIGIRILLNNFKKYNSYQQKHIKYQVNNNLDCEQNLTILCNRIFDYYINYNELELLNSKLSYGYNFNESQYNNLFRVLGCFWFRFIYQSNCERIYMLVEKIVKYLHLNKCNLNQLITELSKYITTQKMNQFNNYLIILVKFKLNLIQQLSKWIEDIKSATIPNNQKTFIVFKILVQQFRINQQQQKKCVNYSTVQQGAIDIQSRQQTNNTDNKNILEKWILKYWPQQVHKCFEKPSQQQPTQLQLKILSQLLQFNYEQPIASSIRIITQYLTKKQILLKLLTMKHISPNLRAKLLIKLNKSVKDSRKINCKTLQRYYIVGQLDELGNICPQTIKLMNQFVYQLVNQKHYELINFVSYCSNNDQLLYGILMNSNLFQIFSNHLKNQPISINIIFNYSSWINKLINEKSYQTDKYMQRNVSMIFPLLLTYYNRFTKAQVIHDTHYDSGSKDKQTIVIQLIENCLAMFGEIQFIQHQKFISYLILTQHEYKWCNEQGKYFQKCKQLFVRYATCVHHQYILQLKEFHVKNEKLYKSINLWLKILQFILQTVPTNITQELILIKNILKCCDQIPIINLYKEQLYNLQKGINAHYSNKQNQEIFQIIGFLLYKLIHSRQEFLAVIYKNPQLVLNHFNFTAYTEKQFYYLVRMFNVGLNKTNNLGQLAIKYFQFVSKHRSANSKFIVNQVQIIPYNGNSEVQILWRLQILNFNIRELNNNRKVFIEDSLIEKLLKFELIQCKINNNQFIIRWLIQVFMLINILYTKKMIKITKKYFPTLKQKLLNNIILIEKNLHTPLKPITQFEQYLSTKVFSTSNSKNRFDIIQKRLKLTLIKQYINFYTKSLGLICQFDQKFLYQILQFLNDIWQFFSTNIVMVTQVIERYRENQMNCKEMNQINKHIIPLTHSRLVGEIMQIIQNMLLLDIKIQMQVKICIENLAGKIIKFT